MKSSVHVYVDPACDFLYASFYIHGLRQLFPSLSYSSRYFKSFKHNNCHFAFVLRRGKSVFKGLIDFGDSYEIDAKALEWCDVYGKININAERCALSTHPKLMALGPGFAIRLHAPVKTWRLALINYVKAAPRIGNKRRFFADYYAQLRRQPLSYYQAQPSLSDYIFFAGALWKKEQETNRTRANYIRACRRLSGVRFEGGFAPRSQNDIPGYEDLTMAANVPMADYLLKLKESATVFNTPVILDCHGWKLGEFMALGKAVVATPVINQLPRPLNHGEEVLFVNGSEEQIYAALEKLIGDKALRRRLEENIRAYYLEYVAPDRAIARLLKHGCFEDI